MLIFLSKFLGLPVILFQERARVGEITEVVIAPENGFVLGFLVYDLVTKSVRAISLNEVKKISKEYLMVGGYDSVSEIDDVARMREAIKEEPQIIGAKVYTESGTYLGKVNEATINLKNLRVESLFVTPAYSFKILATDLVINIKNIVKIEKRKIFVRDAISKKRHAYEQQVSAAEI